MTVLLSGCAARLASAASPEDNLRKFLQEYLKTPGLAAEKTTRYYPAFVGLSGGPPKEVVVYVTGQSWCGSGGCTTLILAPQGSSYKIVTKITITRPPIRLLRTKSHGWRDLSVRVQGGGIQPGYDAKLSFDGRTYPRNPSVPPAEPIHAEHLGDVLVPAGSEGTQLYDY